MGSINHVATIVAGVAHFALGAGWYMLLSQAWLAAIGKTEAELQGGRSPLPFVIAIAVSLIIAYTIAWLLPRLNAQTLAGGIRVGLFLALTLIATTLALNYGFEQRPVSLWLINAGYMIVGLALVGAIVGGWKRKAS
ncbi:MAG: DUF1761 domain-containing protein [Casimicrobiaceae bacterium]